MKDKYCIKSIAPFHTINQSPTNLSASKQTFSFSKGARFEPIKANCPSSTYNGTEIVRKNSGAFIGYGTKIDWTKTTIKDNPEAGQYSIASIFDKDKLGKRGATIGTSRENVKFNAYIDEMRVNNPGIGRYKLEDENLIRTSRAPAFSMGHKTKPSDLRRTIQPQNQNPSPADYDNNPEKSKTLYASHFKKTGFVFTSSERFKNSNVKLPAPGDYENPTGLSGVGKYLVSNQKGGTQAKFDKKQRFTKFDEAKKVGQTKPGPGAYRSTSQFGQYDGDVYRPK